MAWKPFATAGKLNRDDVARRMIMRTARFTIDLDAVDLDAVNCHTFYSRGHASTSNDATTQHAIMTAKPVLNEPVR